MIRRSPQIDWTLDLGGLLFSDVSGIRALIDVAEDASPGRRLVVQGLPPLIRKVMAVVGWSDLPSLVIEEGSSAGRRAGEGLSRLTLSCAG